ncbi:MAG: hypothetical protein KatS3mg068_1914 [Candidatus Sericytochromatia bacterium]|nr:MAG: hypothetical protein KatS3mg068_1914 [Candidatus Sericytochromatia bacterium]
MKYKVILKEKNQLSSNIYQLIFELESEYRFYPGQWIDFFLTIDNKEYISGYSIVSTPLEKNILELGIKSSNNKVTSYLFKFAKKQETFYISQAQGKIYFVPSINKNILLIAGGIGITPLISIFKFTYQINYPFEVCILYSSKNMDDLVYKKDIDKIVSLNKNFKSNYFITDKNSKSFTGRINKEILSKFLKENQIFFLCGPNQMINDINNYLLNLKINSKNIFFEKWW